MTEHLILGLISLIAMTAPTPAPAKTGQDLEAGGKPGQQVVQEQPVAAAKPLPGPLRESSRSGEGKRRKN